MKRSDGFTLIELMITLVILSILSLMSMGLIKQAAVTRDRVKATSILIQNVDTALLILKQDISALIPRSIREEATDLQEPFFIGRSDSLTLTRGGLAQDLSDQANTGLQRLAYRMDKKSSSLIRLTWPVLDRLQPMQPEMRRIFDSLKNPIQFEYLDSKNRFQSNWDSKTENGLPRAVRVSLRIDGLSCQVLFRIPAVTGPSQDASTAL